MEPPCHCSARYKAMHDGEFMLHFTLGGWVFTPGPMRRMTPKAAYLASERGSDNHTGEPFVWVHDCPFCGKLLPPATTEVIWRLLQGDGGE